MDIYIQKYAKNLSKTNQSEAVIWSKIIMAGGIQGFVIIFSI